MNVYLSFLQSAAEHPIPAYSFWQYYIKNGLEEAGHTWTEHPDVDWALGLVPKEKEAQERWRHQAWEKTVHHVKKVQPDLFLGYLYPQQIERQAIAEIRKAGIPCVNFFCDNVRNFRKIPSEFAPFDLHWVPELEAVQLYEKAGYPFINLPMPVWIDPAYRKLSIENNRRVSFIGSPDIQRWLLFEEVLKQHPALPLDIYGKGWLGTREPETIAAIDYSLRKKARFQWDTLRTQGIVPYFRKLNRRRLLIQKSELLLSRCHAAPGPADYRNITAGSMITLGCNRFPSNWYPMRHPGTYSRLRDLEAPMLGACYLTEWTGGLENLYDTETEIACYKSAGELIAKVEELEGDGEKRDLLRANGQKRALNNHSIPHTIRRIICFLNL